MTAAAGYDGVVLEGDVIAGETLSVPSGMIRRWLILGDTDAARYVPSPSFIGFR